MWLSGVGTVLQTERSLVQFPARARAWVEGQVPSVWEATNLCFFLCCFPLCLPPFLLSKNEYIKSWKQCSTIHSISTVAPDEKWPIICIIAPLYIMCTFPVAAFTIFSLSFSCFTMKCWGVVFVFTLLEVCGASFISKFISHLTWETVSHHFFKKSFPATLSSCPLRLQLQICPITWY